MMEAVDKRWYIGYTWWITFNAVTAIVLSTIAIFIPRFEHLSSQWGMTPMTLALAVATLIFRVFFYRKMADQMGLNFATFIYAMIQVANFINILNVTGWSHSWFFSYFMIAYLFSGFTGIFPTIGCVVLSTTYLIIILPGQIQNGFDPFEIIAISLSYVAAIISYFAWRHQYIDQESQRIISLRGELAGKEKQAEMLIKSIADGIIVIDKKGDVTLINDKACKLVGWPKTEALGFDGVAVLNIMQDEKSLKSLDFTEHPFRKVLENKEDFAKTVQILNRDNNNRLYISLVVSPVISPSHNNVIGGIAVIRDVSEEKKQEQQRAEFISTASHEMRTPVAAIEGYLALAMNDKVSSIDAKAKSYLEKAHASTQHLGKLFQDLLTSAKAEDGRLTSHPVPVEMKDYLEKLSQDLHFAAKKKGLDVELVINTHDTSKVTDTTVSNLQNLEPVYYTLVDPDRIREVITNVFDNAVKYTDSGKITLGLTGNEQVIQIFVKDTGPGIPPNDVPHLFQKFYRVDNSATRTIGGTGLGLFICKKIVELYGGTIWAESILGKGSTFFINLPRLSAIDAQKALQQGVDKPQSLEPLTTQDSPLATSKNMVQ